MNDKLVKAFVAGVMATASVPALALAVGIPWKDTAFVLVSFWALHLWWIFVISLFFPATNRPSEKPKRDEWVFADLPEAGDVEGFLEQIKQQAREQAEQLPDPQDPRELYREYQYPGNERRGRHHK